MLIIYDPLNFLYISVYFKGFVINYVTLNHFNALFTILDNPYVMKLNTHCYYL